MFFARPGAGREVRCGSPAGSELAPTEAAAETQAQPVNGGNRIDVSPNRERRGKRKGWAQDAKCVQAQPGGPPGGIRTPGLQNRNLA